MSVVTSGVTERGDWANVFVTERSDAVRGASDERGLRFQALQALLQAADAGAGADALQALQALLQAADTGAGADALQALQALLQAADAGAGADALQALLQALQAVDSGAGADTVAAILQKLAFRGGRPAREVKVRLSHKMVGTRRVDVAGPGGKGRIRIAVTIKGNGVH